ncbi:MAG: 50S ribosomal protein L15 [Candidatus Magasanikbacteria bacterium GW2011_GWC2_37_14]|uniref:Large ribosomal subunit protein uL15 n=1 Tax=Candidatus Magasanikbacteria bacterium GW2011_GWC2_37_14 TaxID=1619046 RepID=A0A0G0GB06_9BACT|nr:MAG: 50S ribosomal protein L15 [Candidatus Magasanikbacteria bacterium GW2011_GWC2_37_14]
MVLTPATIAPAKGATRNIKRVGRGNASGRGTFSGRGGKGQTARSGGKSRTQFRGFKAYLQKVPKLRGFKSIHAKLETITLKTLNRVVKTDVEVTPNFLKQKGLISKPANGVKIVGTEEVKVKMTVKGCVLSKGALSAIEKAGGKVIF